MNGCFHRRRHEHSPYQHFFSIEKVEYPSVIPNFFGRNWKILVRLLIVRVFHVLKLWFWSRTLHRFPCELEYAFSSRCFWSCSSCQQFPEAIRAFSCRLTWQCAISDLEADPQLFPDANSTSFGSSAFTGLTGYTKSCGVFLCVLPSWVVSPSLVP